MKRRVFGGAVVAVGLAILGSGLAAVATGRMSTATRGGAGHSVSWAHAPGKFLLNLGLRTALGAVIVAGGVSVLRMEDGEAEKGRRATA